MNINDKVLFILKLLGKYENIFFYIVYFVSLYVYFGNKIINLCDNCIF